MKHLTCFTLLITLWFTPLLLSKKDTQKEILPLKYKKWLEEEVVYIITPVEKDIFRKLRNDRERDIFIKGFWKQRDPNPNTPENEYKIEHYRRFDYANKHFGKESPAPGWRSEMGRHYIILGEPNAIDRHLNTTGIHPTVIWFYSGKIEMGLPNSFSLVFFKRDGIGEYELYSPVKDGPAALMEHYMGDLQDHGQAFDELFSIDQDVARHSMTLIGGEEHTEMLSPSLSSELLISTNIPKAPYKSAYESYAKRFLNYKGIVDVNHLENYVESDFTIKLVRSQAGITYLHYMIDPRKLSLERVDDLLYTNIEVNGQFTDENNHQIYKFTRKIPVKLPVSRLKSIQSQLFSFQDQLPIISGTYKYYMLFMNSAGMEFTSHEGTLVVPEEKKETSMGSIILANRRFYTEKYKNMFKPFMVNNIQLSPSPRDDFNNTDTLYTFFQILKLTPELKNSGKIEYKIISDKDKKVVLVKQKAIAEYSDGLNFMDSFPLKNLAVDYYNLAITILNKDGRALQEKRADFYISPMPLNRSWALSLPEKSTAIVSHLNILGNQYFNKGDYEKAFALLGKAFQSNTKSTIYALDYAKVLFKFKAYKEIKKVIAGFLQGPDKNRFLLISGNTNAALGEYDSAIKDYTNYLLHYGVNISVLNQLANCYIKVGDTKAALEILERSFSEDPSQTEIKEKIAQLKAEGGKQDEKTKIK